MLSASKPSWSARARAASTTCLRRYWEIPFAFSVFTIAGFAADVSVSPVQRLFVQDVLREAPTANNPLASTVEGTALVQLFSTLCIVVPIVVLIKASGSDLGSIFISRSRSWVVRVIGLVCLLGFYFLAARGRTAAFFPNSGVTPSRFLALTPALLVLVLLNGLREELWFRGLFLKRFEQFLGPWPSNLLTAVVFISFHVQVQYALHLLPFLGFTLILGLFFRIPDAEVREPAWPGPLPCRLRHPDLPRLPLLRLDLKPVERDWPRER